jgi:hypothetical protein
MEVPQNYGYTMVVTASEHVEIDEHGPDALGVSTLHFTLYTLQDDGVTLYQNACNDAPQARPYCIRASYKVFLRTKSLSLNCSHGCCCA